MFFQSPDEMIRDAIVCGIRDQDTRELLILEGSNLSLEKAMEMVFQNEANKKKIQMKKQKQDQVNPI